MSRFLSCSLVFVCVCVSTFTTTQASEKPNVVVILTDDQGWGDLSVNGNANLSTPNIDSLAADGATMNNFYVCSVCAPTRAEFLTGRYHLRTGVSGVSRGEGRLNADETTIADLFHQADYATGAFGKWHNGTQPPLHPNYRGFDEYYGFTSGHWGHYFSPPLDHNGQKVRGKGFIVDDFTNHAIDFIKTNRDKPFFCYLPLNTPHSPMMVEDRFYEKFAGKELSMKHREPQREDIMMTRAALAMCENIDWNVGRVLKTIDDLLLRDNTIVVFFCDNGPNSYRFNGAMKGKKGTVDEGGLRSPFFIRWPGKVQQGRRVETICAAIDLLPTLTDLAEIESATAHAIDGKSFKPLLTQDNPRWESRTLFSSWKNKATARTQQFRIDNTGALYDIQADRGQTTDVSEKHPQKANHLRKLLKNYRDEMETLRRNHANRPFAVGYAKSTTLPARDAIEHGTIKRSAKPPNNSFFTNWTSTDDSITWEIEVLKAGVYETTVYYTCAQGDQGSTVIAGIDGGESVQAAVAKVFDPPLYDKSKERVSESHYFVKDFIPIKIGNLKLNAGTHTLRLKAADIKGDQVIDVHSIELVR